MEFSPHNDVVKRCLQAMALEANGQPEAAGAAFLEAWGAASHDLERFLAAYFVARSQGQVVDRLHWLEKALHHALLVDAVAVQGVLPRLYDQLADCCTELGQEAQAAEYRAQAAAAPTEITDRGPFFHGTKAAMQVGDALTPGFGSNYQQGLVMNHIYFTGLMHGAGLAAALAQGDGPPRVYVVEPTGPFEHDPNVTDKKFPGNLTRSYRTASPLRVVGEIAEWEKQTPEDLAAWREKLARNGGEIIN